MNKKNLIEKLAKVVSTKKEASQVLERLIKEIKQSLWEGEKVIISEFGCFYVQVRKAKKGRNPRTGKVVDIPPRKAVKFRPAKNILKN